MEVLNSVNNPKVKYWYKLKTKKYREELGLYLFEGIKLLEEAVKSNIKIKNILIEENSIYQDRILALLANEKDKILKVSKSIVNKLSDTSSPQGIIAVVEDNLLELKDEQLLQYNSLLLIDQIKEPGNLGTIIRSADAAGLDAIVINEGSVDLFNSKVIRSSMGSIFHIPIYRINLDDIIPKLKNVDFNIIGTSPYAEKEYFKLDLTKNIAIIIGNESKGLSEERIKMVDEMVNIPMVGQAESLNVAMATTIILFERIRQIKFYS